MGTMHSAGVLDMLSDKQPLLSTPPPAAAAAAVATAAAPDGIAGSGGAPPGVPGASVALQFPQRLASLMELLRPYPALALSLLAVAEALVVAQVGKVAGSFYRIIVDQQPARLAAAMLHAAALYAACTVLYAAATWITELLALRWRRRLTTHLHGRYCEQHAFYSLQQRRLEQKQQQDQQEQLAHGGMGDAAFPEAGTTAPPPPGAAAVDNPDQRIASDAAALCDCLADLARVVAAAPFKILYYSWLTRGYLGWRGVLAVYAFFCGAGALQRLVVAPLARLVFEQERREGDLRYAHLRLREHCAEVAQYKAEGVERRALDEALEGALANQQRLVGWRTVLACTTRALDYCGALLNYGCVAAAVFAGWAGRSSGGGGEAGGNDGGSGGEAAQFVSNASFATLSLIYSFSELLDLSDRWSRLVGLAARVGELLEVLPVLGDGNSSGRDGGKPGGGRVAATQDLLAVRLQLEGQELQPSRFAETLQPPQLLSCLGGTVELELSVHQLGADLRHEAANIFPDAPASSGQLLALITFQFAAGGLSLAPDSNSATLEKATAEMDRMLDAFLRWESAVRGALEACGCWCDAVDPRTGLALHGRRGSRWSEVAAAHALLGYERRDAGVCPVVVHPRHGSSAYPATLFTDASPQQLAAALAALARPAATSSSSLTASTAAAVLLRLQHVSVRTPAGGLAVGGLDLELRPGQHVLIVGPNGCGKSTLVKALCGLQPPEGGSLQLPGGNGPLLLQPQHNQQQQQQQGGVMCVPQRPLAAPGAALWQQVCYPGGGGDGGDGDDGQWAAEGRRQRQRPDDDALLLGLLRRVGLAYLLDRVGGSLAAPADWAAMLSPGELQRLAVARVLLRRPALVLLDEATSAVSEAAARHLYGQLHADGITCVSIGQDCEHLRRLHPLLLRLGCGPAEGAWRLEAAEQSPLPG